MLPGVVFAALAALSPAAPLPYTAREAEPYRLDTEPVPLCWVLYLRHEPGAAPVGYAVPRGMVLVIEGRRADLGELPGLFDHRWFAGDSWRFVTRAKSCRAWVRGGRLEALEVMLR